MMGYTIDNIDTYRGTLMNVRASGVCNKKQAKILDEIEMFLEGLIVEGRI